MGLVNTVVPLEDLEKETVRWCREVLQHSPMALRCLKAALNADCDGQAGLQELAGNATMMFYMTDEGKKVVTHSTRNVAQTSTNSLVTHNPYKKRSHALLYFVFRPERLALWEASGFSR